MGTNSPVDNKQRITVKSEDSIPHTQPPTISTQAPSGHNEQKSEIGTSQRDAQKNSTQNEVRTNDTPDYFSLPRPNRLDQEPNPFEQSFASGNATTNSADPLATPKAILPPVTAMTSPAPLLGGSGSYNWGPNSLRSGPLSPAMLQGPANPSSLGFDTLRTGLTPNESGIRSGLTPGGSGSMFPAPSPSTSQFLFGGTTPGTMEFQKTALSAARKSTHPQPPLIPPQSELKNEDTISHSNAGLNDQPKPRQPSDPFNADPAHNAANGLYLLAQMGAPANGYAPHMSSGIPPSATNNLDSSPNLAKRAAMNSATSAANRAASNSAAPNGVRGISEASHHRSDSSEEPENGAGRKGRNARGKATSAATGKRKNDGGSDSGKIAASKKSKNVRATSDDGEGDDYEEDGQNDMKKDGKKMTDEEKRKNFLERNRVAALKCRQRKKQWLANLQAKVEMYGTENDALNATVQSLREEIVSLKTLLLAHKDCPVARANGVQLDIASMTAGAGEYGHVPMMQPYTGMMTGVMHQQPPGERRYS